MGLRKHKDIVSEEFENISKKGSGIKKRDR